MNTPAHHTTKSAPPQFLTSSDIAAHYGVAVAAVSNWRRRYGPDSPTPFPAPDDTDPVPVWRWERWQEIHAWQERRGAQRPGPRTALRQQADGQYLMTQDIAERLNVTPAAVRHWRRAPLPNPFPEPDKEITQQTRTIPLWRQDRWPDIHAWREWHLTHGSGQQRRPRTSQRESDGLQPSPQAALPPPSDFLKLGRSTSRSAVRQGRVAHPRVRRMTS